MENKDNQIKITYEDDALYFLCIFFFVIMSFILLFFIFDSSNLKADIVYILITASIDLLCVLAYLYLKTYYVIIDKNEEIIIEHKVGITKMMKLSDISSISSSKDNGAIYLIIRSNNKMRIKINIYSTSWHTKEMIDYLKRKGILSYKFKV